MDEAVFPDVSYSQWLESAEHFLKGKSFATLVRHTESGIARGPLFTERDLPAALARFGRIDVPNLDGRPWHILAPVRGPDIAHANDQALADLEGGASALYIEPADLSIERRADIDRLLEGVFTDLAPIVVAPGSRNRDIAELLVGMEGLSSAHVCLGLDPAEIDDLSAYPDNWRALTIAPSRLHELGAGPVLELAVLAAQAADAFREFGHQTPDHLVIEIAADQDAHLGIAKFRTARRLTSRIAEAFGASGKAIPIHAISSLRMMQAQDPWTDLLRVCNATFGAVVGGADFILARPFTDALGAATPFAHRLARNTQLLMMEESHLGHAQDAAFGSYWHESVGERLAVAAWLLFQEIEAVGGLATFLTSGELERRLKADREARSGEPVLGVTLHPRPDDVPLPEVRA